jgi:hypothetical protein
VHIFAKNEGLARLAPSDSGKNRGCLTSLALPMGRPKSMAHLDLNAKMGGENGD